MRVCETVPRASGITIGQLRASENLIRKGAGGSEDVGGRGQKRSEQKSRRTTGNQDFWLDRAMIRTGLHAGSIALRCRHRAASPGVAGHERSFDEMMAHRSGCEARQNDKRSAP